MSDANSTIEIRLNGEPRHVSTTTTVEQVVELLTTVRQGCAVARNGEILPQNSWKNVVVVAGDHVEVLTASPGG